jgi:hypothetical protein
VTNDPSALCGALVYVAVSNEGGSDMTASEGLIIVAGIWLLVGLTLALMMRRRGHDFWVWAALGCVLGPWQFL